MMKTFPIRATACAITVLLSGCAALRIDVDVYQGPLSNDAQTQTMQLASMVLAAKPLLEDAKNNLNCKSEAKGQSAACVTLQGTLTLYDSTQDNRVSQSLDKVKDRFEEYKKAVKVLDEKRVKLNLQTPPNLDGTRKLLWDKTYGFLTRKKAEDTISFTAADVLNKAQKLNEELVASGKPLCIQNVPPFARASADLATLWSTKEKAANFLTCKALSDFQDNFDRARRASANAWNGLASSAEVWSSTLEPSILGQKNRQEVTSMYAGAIADFIQLKHLSCALTTSEPSKAIDWLKKELKTKSPNSLLLPQSNPRNADWETSDYKSASDDLEAMLNIDMKQTISVLRELDVKFMSTSDQQTQLLCSTLNKAPNIATKRSEVQAVSSLDARRFGIARGPSLTNPKDSLDPDAIIAKLSVLADKVSAGFSGGRINDGITSLTRNLANERASDKNVGKNVKKLQDALVSMGDRLRFIAANNWTIDGGSDQTQLPDETRALFEAVGNAILAHADEAWSRDRYNQNNERLAKVDYSAIRREFSGNSTKLAADIELAISAKVADALKKKQANEKLNTAAQKLQKTLEDKAKSLESQVTAAEKKQSASLKTAGDAYYAVELLEVTSKLNAKSSLDLIDVSKDTAVLERNQQDLRKYYSGKIGKTQTNGFTRVGK
jgi:hypothetical protein